MGVEREEKAKERKGETREWNDGIRRGGRIRKKDGRKGTKEGEGGRKKKIGNRSGNGRRGNRNEAMGRVYDVTEDGEGREVKEGRERSRRGKEGVEGRRGEWRGREGS